MREYRSFDPIVPPYFPNQLYSIDFNKRSLGHNWGRIAARSCALNNTVNLEITSKQLDSLEGCELEGQHFCHTQAEPVVYIIGEGRAGLETEAFI